MVELIEEAQQQIEWADAMSDTEPLIIAVSLHNDVLAALAGELARLAEANRAEVAA